MSTANNTTATTAAVQTGVNAAITIAGAVLPIIAGPAGPFVVIAEALLPKVGPLIPPLVNALIDGLLAHKPDDVSKEAWLARFMGGSLLRTGESYAAEAGVDLSAEPPALPPHQRSASELKGIIDTAPAQGLKRGDFTPMEQQTIIQLGGFFSA